MYKKMSLSKSMRQLSVLTLKFDANVYVIMLIKALTTLDDGISIRNAKSLELIVELLINGIELEIRSKILGIT